MIIYHYLFILLLICQVGNISGHSLPINNLMFSVKDNHQLVTVSDDQKLKVNEN